MEKVSKPKGLIRYATHKQIEQKEKFRLTPRAIAYSCLLIGLISFFSGLLFLRGDLGVSVLHSPGTTFSKTAEGNFSNIYNLAFRNKSAHERVLKLGLKGIEGKLTIIGNLDEIHIEPSGEWKGALMIELSPEKVKKNSFEIHLSVEEKGKEVTTAETLFLGPLIF